MQRFTIPYGKQSLELCVPDDVDVQVLLSNPVETASDVEAAVKAAVLNPIGCPRLKDLARPGQKVAIIVTDITRKLPEEIILPILLDELEAAGVSMSDVKGVIATGTHRPNTPDEIIEMFGRDVYERIEFINHDAYDKEQLVYLGKSARGIPLVTNRFVAEADLRISTGVVETHLFAGYSGGVKSVAVGVAGEETIAATHNAEMLQHPSTRLGVVEGNIFREFLTEATRAVGLDFIVNVVQTGDKRLVQAVAGDPVAAFEEAVKTARRLYEIQIDQQADIVVSCVSYPKSRDLYQATRAANTVVFGPKPIVKQGGKIIIPTPCEDGLGHEGYYHLMKNEPSVEALLAKLQREGFAPGEQKAMLLGKIVQWAQLVVTDCLIEPKVLQDLFITPMGTVQEALDAALAENPGAKVYIIPDGPLTLPILS